MLTIQHNFINMSLYWFLFQVKQILSPRSSLSIRSSGFNLEGMEGSLKFEDGTYCRNYLKSVFGDMLWTQFKGGGWSGIGWSVVWISHRTLTSLMGHNTNVYRQVPSLSKQTEGSQEGGVESVKTSWTIAPVRNLAAAQLQLIVTLR